MIPDRPLTEEALLLTMRKAIHSDRVLEATLRDLWRSGTPMPYRNRRGQVLRYIGRAKARAWEKDAQQRLGERWHAT